MNTLIRCVIKYRLTVFIVVAAITVVALASLTRLKVIIDPVTMLPGSHPYSQTRPLLENRFHEKYALLISLTPSDGNLHSPAFLQKLVSLTAELQRLPGVVKPTLLTPVHNHSKAILGHEDGFEVRPFRLALADTGRFSSWLAVNPILQQTLISDDQKSVAFIAQFDPDPMGYNVILSRVEQVLATVEDESVVIRLSGHIQFLGEIERYSMRMLVLIPLAILLIALVHYEAFRTWQGMILPLVTAILALLWVLGIFGALDMPLDVFNSTTPILVLAVAAGHAVQILKRYMEEYEELRSTTGLSPTEANTEAIVRAMVKVGPLMITAGTIAAMGFFSLIVFEMGSVKAFGFFTGAGILSALCIEIIFIPALRSCLHPPQYPMQRLRNIWPAVMRGIACAVQWRGLMPSAIIFLLLALSGAGKVVIDNSNRANFAPWTTVRQQDEFINTHFAGTQLLYAVLDTGKPSGALQPAVLHGLDSIQKSLSLEPGVGKTVSLADYLKRMQQAMHNDEPAQFILPDSAELAAQYLLLYSNSGDAEDLVSFIDNEQQRLVLKIFVKQDETRFIEQLIAKVQALAAKQLPSDLMVVYGGGVAEAAAINEVLAHDKLKNMAQILVVVFVLSGLFFRSVAAAFLVISPLAVTVVGVFGIMGWNGIPLNIPTSLIAAMSIGIGADYAIYLLARFREEAQKSTDISDVLEATLQSAGKACLYVAIAVAVGYGVLALSWGFRVHQWMALLIGSAMLISVMATLLLVSWLVVRYRPAFVFGSK